MVFAVEEINRDSSLLPGVTLGYRIIDSCDNVHTSLQALYPLISHSKAVATKVKQGEESENRSNKDIETRMEVVKTEKTKKMLITMKDRGAEGSTVMLHNLENGENDMTDNVTEERINGSTQSETLPSCLASSPVPAVIGLASSSPTRAVAHTLGAFNIPLVRKK